MADSKVTDLTALTSVAPTDILYIVDDPGGTPLSKKATVSDTILGGVNSMTALTSVATTDILFIVDDPSGTPLARKTTVNDLLEGGLGSGNTVNAIYVGNPTLTTDNQFYFGTVSATKPKINWDNADWMDFDRTNNLLQVYIGSDLSGTFRAAEFWGDDASGSFTEPYTLSTASQASLKIGLAAPELNIARANIMVRLNNTSSSTASAQLMGFYGKGSARGGLRINASDNGVELFDSSDYRLKQDVVDADILSFGQIIDDYPLREFAMKTDPTLRIIGSIAHELQAVLPSAVAGEKDAVDENGEMIIQTVAPSATIPYLWGAAKHLKHEIDAIKAHLGIN